MKIIIPFFLLALLSACTINMGKKVDGNGNLKKEQKDLTGFTGIEVGGPFQVMVQQGSSYSVSVEADDNLLQFIEIKKEGNTLKIDERDNYNLESSKGIKITVQTPEVDELTLAGSGLITATGTLTSKNKLQLEIGGSGKIQAEVDAPEVSVAIGGSGTATLSGQTRTMKISIGGSGNCLSEALKSEDCKVSIGGSGTAKVYASQTLGIDIGGSGNVYYAGQPKISQSVAGSGTIKPL